ncbi:glycoside hydrolase family 2 TIM barrel-domain containing protein [Rhodopirellula sp. SWK7]|uniref:glycoside hydrolase family 2 TIM barrel-domain containing protein n=1 Tax=Rhodopirellula sp. SWK7 TaxID=595460 RepID=UPI0003467522|nr:glycoside hydrolase family 2 TIM barrel-domain containing protein [Rhodopirellula sp. SWK7]
MSHPRPSLRLFMFVVAALTTASNVHGGDSRAVDFNSGWLFSLQEQPAHSVDVDDTAWRHVQLPHDWSVESPFDPTLEGCTAYLPGGIGWYRKHFETNVDDDHVTYVHFDGIYNRAEIWLNGVKLGFHPYGYSPLFYDITDHLNAPGEDNILVVKVDHSRYADSRWYTGSGIYRDVKLIQANKLHVPIWGTFVTTPKVSTGTSEVAIDIQVQNAFDRPKTFQLLTKIVDSSGDVVANEELTAEISAKITHTFHQDLSVTSPRLWNLDDPSQYVADTTIISDGEVIDSYQTPFGFRDIKFDAESGFYLNGEHTLIQGVCLHHDAGLAGAAVPTGVWERRLSKLKAGGCNAIRTAHNPASEKFLDLCDRMGFLVQEEFYDEWDNPKDKRLNMAEQHDDRITRGHAEFFQDWAERDLNATMRRDRNHPSIFQWSIGNEIEWTYPKYREASGYFDADASGNYFWTPPHLTPDEVRTRYQSIPDGTYVLADTAKKLAQWTREMDTTRPVTSNCILPSVSHVTGYTDALDVVGYSYRRVVYGYSREHFPGKPVMGTENVAQWHEWKAVLERPFISGVFLWTGIDYMGEAREDWPRKGVLSGLLDTAGFEKPSYHMMKTLWGDEPHIYLATQTLPQTDYHLDATSGVIGTESPDAWTKRTWVWHSVNHHWNYKPGDDVVVEVYSNTDRVEVLLNGRSLGIKSLSDFPDRIFKWLVPYEPGVLEARAVHCDAVIRNRIKTAGPPASVSLTPDTTELVADNRDVAHVVAQLVDADGIPVRDQELDVVFEIEGVVRVLGVDNGSGKTVTQYQSNRVVTHQGRCLLLVQSTGKSGVATIRAHADNLQSRPITIDVR